MFATARVVSGSKILIGWTVSELLLRRKMLGSKDNEHRGIMGMRLDGVSDREGERGRKGE